MGRLSIEGVLTEAFETYRDDPVDFLVLGLLSGVVPFLLALAVLAALWGAGFLVLVGALGGADPGQAIETVFGDPESLTTFLLTFLGGLVAAVLVGVAAWTLFYGALLARASDREGTGGDVGAALRTGLDRILPLLGVFLVVTLLFLAVLAVPLGLFAWSFLQVAGTGDVGGAFVGAGLGLLLLLGGGLVLLVAVAGLLVAPPLAVLEGLDPAAALRRSWQLTRHRKLAILVIVLVGVVVQAVVGLAVDLVLTPFGLFGADPTLLSAVIAGTLNAPVWPLLSLKAYEQLSAPTPEPVPAPGEPPGPPTVPGGGADDATLPEGYVPLE